MPDHSNCCVAETPVSARRYVQVIPLQKLGDTTAPTYTITRRKAGREIERTKSWPAVIVDGEKWAVPHDVAEERIDGKKFVNLAPEPGEIVEALDLDPKAVYELRHNPPRKLAHVPAAQMAEFSLRDRRGRLTNGRHVQINRFYQAKHADGTRVPTFEVDYGVLQKYTCRGGQASDQIDLWRKLLLEQLLEG